MTREELDALKKEVSEIENMALKAMNSRISFNFELPYADLSLAGTTPASVPVWTRTSSFVTDKSVRTYVKGIEFAGTVIGDVDSNPAAINFGPEVITSFFDFVMKIRDTGSDREWSNAWMPSQVLYSGSVQGFRTGAGHFLVSPGSEINVTIGNTYFDSAAIPVVTNITQLIITISLVGFTVPA